MRAQKTHSPDGIMTTGGSGAGQLVVPLCPLKLEILLPMSLVGRKWGPMWGRSFGGGGGDSVRFLRRSAI